jgi:hypothetical protein
MAQSSAATSSPLPAPPLPSRRSARLAQFLALAHHIAALIHRGGVRDIQEEIRFADAVDGREPFAERDACKVALIPEWSKQREAGRAATADVAAAG